VSHFAVDHTHLPQNLLQSSVPQAVIQGGILVHKLRDKNVSTLFVGHDQGLQLLQGYLPILETDGGFNAGILRDELDQRGELGHLQLNVAEW